MQYKNKHGRTHQKKAKKSMAECAMAVVDPSRFALGFHFMSNGHSVKPLQGGPLSIEHENPLPEYDNGFSHERRCDMKGAK